MDRDDKKQNITGRVLAPVIAIYVARSFSRVAIVANEFGAKAAMAVAVFSVAPLLYGIFMRKSVSARDIVVLMLILLIAETGAYLTECWCKGQLRHLFDVPSAVIKTHTAVAIRTRILDI